MEKKRKEKENEKTRHVWIESEVDNISSTVLFLSS
jgi:hypothetical protein